MLWRGRLVGAWLQPSESVGSAAVDLPTRRPAAILSALVMRLVMTLLVRNEEDIIAANLDYHLAMGVDHIIITDNSSIDASPEIVRGYVERGVATLIHEPADDYSQSVWVTRMARLACKSGADWVINSDA